MNLQIQQGSANPKVYLGINNDDLTRIMKEWSEENSLKVVSWSGGLICMESTPLVPGITSGGQDEGEEDVPRF